MFPRLDAPCGPHSPAQARVAVHGERIDRMVVRNLPITSVIDNVVPRKPQQEPAVKVARGGKMCNPLPKRRRGISDEGGRGPETVSGERRLEISGPHAVDSALPSNIAQLACGLVGVATHKDGECGGAAVPIAAHGWVPKNFAHTVKVKSGMPLWVTT